MTDVKCKVNSCHYWGKGDICKADTILIDEDRMRQDTTRMEASSLDLHDDRRILREDSSARVQKGRKGRGRMETGLIGGVSGKEEPVQTSETTCCRTYRPKNSPKLS